MYTEYKTEGAWRGRTVGHEMMQGRLAEWITSSVMVTFAIVLALPGDTFADNRAFSLFTDYGVTELMLAVPPALIGIGRLAALWINGNWRRSPVVRAVGAVLGATMYSVLSISMLWPTISGTASAFGTGFATYGMLALFDVLAAYRAGHDARVSRV